MDCRVIQSFLFNIKILRFYQETKILCCVCPNDLNLLHFECNYESCPFYIFQGHIRMMQSASEKSPPFVPAFNDFFE